MIARKLQTRTGPWPIGTLVRQLVEGSTKFSQISIHHPRIYDDDSELPLMRFGREEGGFRGESCPMGRIAASFEF